MNKAMLTIGIILLSIISLLIINVINNYSTGGELDYYLVKETADAAMEDAIDYVYLRTCGTYRIDKERFVESFVLRFANSVDGTRDYDIKFYDINEVPPKVSVQVNSDTVLSVRTNSETGKKLESGDISTSYDVILESNNLIDPNIEEGFRHTKEGQPGYDQCRGLNQLK